jgi:hypothetical protein
MNIKFIDLGDRLCFVEVEVVIDFHKEKLSGYKVYAQFIIAHFKMFFNFFIIGDFYGND